jgi:hypothetical protein
MKPKGDWMNFGNEFVEDKKKKIIICAACGQDKQHHAWKRRGFQFTDACDKFIKDDGVYLVFDDSEPGWSFDGAMWNPNGPGMAEQIYCEVLMSIGAL